MIEVLEELDAQALLLGQLPRPLFAPNEGGDPDAAQRGVLGCQEGRQDRPAAGKTGLLVHDVESKGEGGGRAVAGRMTCYALCQDVCDRNEDISNNPQNSHIHVSRGACEEHLQVKRHGLLGSKDHCPE